jgi:multidrug efflux system membrane fusion protein
VVGQVAERDVGRLQVGMLGEARLVTGRTVEGRLRYIGSQADPATRTFRVELEVPNQAEGFAAGLTAELRVVYGRMRAHRLPASLLALDEQGRVGVKAVDQNDQVVFHPAEIVRAEGDALWVAGLPERLRVITVGQGFVRAGEQVRPILESAVEASPQVAERRE